MGDGLCELAMEETIKYWSDQEAKVITDAARWLIARILVTAVTPGWIYIQRVSASCQVISFFWQKSRIWMVSWTEGKLKSYFISFHVKDQYLSWFPALPLKHVQSDGESASLWHCNIQTSQKAM